jgi:gliding motility-associated-like protein
MAIFYKTSIKMATFRFLTAFLLTVLLGTQFNQLAAKHIIGGEVYYECLGETSQGSGINRYLVTMKIYRDCDPQAGGAFFDSPAFFSVYRGSGNTWVSTGNDLSIGEYDFAVIVPDTPACVQNVPYVCVETAQYTFTVDLPVDPNNSYMIVYQRCCRNNSIVNIYDPESVGATYSVEINPRGQQLCNNSAVYNDFPPVIICKDIPLVFDHSATDPDADQLVYRFCAPSDGGGPLLTFPDYASCEGAQPNPPCAPPFDPVPFVQPQFSPTNPMGGDPQVTINPVTGLITGIPDALGRYVVGVCVDEYRSGNLIGTTKRDFQFNVTDCDPTVLAKIDGGDTLVLTPQGYYLSACGAKELYIENKSIDQNFIEEFEWRFDLQGTPYFNNSVWSPIVPFPAPDRYFGQLLLNPGTECGDTAIIIVDIFPEVNADFSFAYDTCVAGPVAFTDLSTGDGIIQDWAWQFGVPNGTSNQQSPTFEYQTPGERPVRLRVTDRNGCEDVISQPLKYLPAPATIIVEPSSFIGCVPGIIDFINLSKPLDETYTIVWDFGDGNDTSGVISPTHIYTEPGLYNVSIAITSPIGCYVTDTFPELIRVVPSPIADFEYSPDVVTNLDPLVTFTDLSVDAERWFWQFDRFDTSTKQSPSFEFPDTGLMRVLLVVTHPEGCKDSIAKFIDVIPTIRWFMPNAFTPNGDGTNDNYFGKGFLEGATNFSMTIWNRWGELVFNTDNPDDQWNGRAQNTGGNAPSGVYIYKVSFRGPRGEPFAFEGFVTLIR